MCELQNDIVQAVRKENRQEIYQKKEIHIQTEIL